MIRIILVISISLFYSQSFAGSEAQISGYAPGAAGEYIEVYRQADPVTGFSSLIERVKVEDNEHFNIRVDCNELCWLRLRYGIYELLVLVEKGVSYETKLPVFRELKVGEKLNPFFKYRLHHLKLDGNNINNSIRFIDSLYYDYTARITRGIYLGEQPGSSDSLVTSFEGQRNERWTGYSLKYFDCRHCLLEMVSEKRHIPSRDDIRLINQEFMPGMPAYTDLISQVFNGYLRHLSDSRGGGAIRDCINSAGPYSDIVDVIAPDGLLSNQSLIEYVILENLYNEYYKNYFRKESIEGIIEQMTENASDDYNRKLAARITEKINRLKPGNKPPGFSLENEDGEIYTLDSLRGKHSILVFGSAALPDTRAELNILKHWARDYNEQLSVVVILLDEDFESSLEKIGAVKYDFIFLDGHSAMGLEDIYELKYLPAFYFLDRDMRLIESPAPFPSENLRRLVVPKL
ncbi:MAG: TlpA family protein disulfide reductase [Bacteroidales bacterium]